jgi:hypothetical protein
MNHAAEQAIPLAKGLLHETIESLSIADAKGILGGGDTSVTQFFESKTRETLTQRFLPEVRKSTAKVGWPTNTASSRPRPRVLACSSPRTRNSMAT